MPRKGVGEDPVSLVWKAHLAFPFYRYIRVCHVALFVGVNITSQAHLALAQSRNIPDVLSSYLT
jgi:hypothetical protein